jgi:hypothetical protein
MLFWQMILTGLDFCSFDSNLLLHGEQYLEVYKPLPTHGNVTYSLATYLSDSLFQDSIHAVAFELNWCTSWRTSWHHSFSWKPFVLCVLFRFEVVSEFQVSKTRVRSCFLLYGVQEIFFICSTILLTNFCHVWCPEMSWCSYLACHECPRPELEMCLVSMGMRGWTASELWCSESCCSWVGGPQPQHGHRRCSLHEQVISVVLLLLRISSCQPCEPHWFEVFQVKFCGKVHLWTSYLAVCAQMHAPPSIFF